MYLEQVRILANKLEIFTNKYADTQLSTFRQNEIEKLLEKNDFKVVTPDKLVMLEKVLSNIQVFNSYFVNKIKNLYTDKVYKKSCPVIYTYNNGKKNLVLIYLPKISRVSYSIVSCLTTIFQNNNNDNIRFYFQNIRQVLIEIASNLNPDFYI